MLGSIWNGSTWQLATPTEPGTETYPYMTGVSCPTSTSCVAVGFYNNLNGPTPVGAPLAESWNGSTWTQMAVPPAAGAGKFSAVTCVNSANCWAAGSDQTSSGINAVVSHWNGNSWVTTDLLNTTGVGLTAISCASAKSCTAVGDVGYGTAGLVAEHWNGRAWSQQTVPIPAGTSFAQLFGISCKASSCEAVGETGQVAPNALVVGLGTGGWQIQTTQLPSGATFTWLNGISCRYASSCSAVGWYKNNSGLTVPLVEHLAAGAWVTQHAPDPAGSTTTILNGVSCVTATSCMAVGSSGGTSSEFPLAESRAFPT